MKVLSAIFLFAAIVTLSALAEALPVVSANGFNCTAQPVGERSLVECMGQFQGVTGIFAATGYDMVHVDFTPDNQRRYSYMSETGCLILAASDKTALATDKAGVKRQFSSFTEAMQWCYTGSAPAKKEAPAGQTQQPAPKVQTPQQPPAQKPAPDVTPPAGASQQAPKQQALPPQPQQR